MFDNILVVFVEDDRIFLEEFGIFCRREEKYGFDLLSEVW